MQTVLVLGATSDIAMAIANKFASHQYNIQLAARSPARLQPLKSDIEIRYHVDCATYSFDAVNFNSHGSFFENLIPKPDITICVFGLLGEEEKAFNDWKFAESIINTNFTGAVSILNIAAKYYISQQKGTIIGISSVAGDRGRASKLIYGSAKAALTSYLSGLRNMCFEENVQVITVKPGFVYTKMTENLPLPKSLTSTPREVANAIYKSFIKKKNVIYIKWFWKYIMIIIKNIPEFQFKKMKL
jgi:decaprenylphospho-beta-D-erythro-pentofuranosid-2-ulose 2-reductase